MGDTSNVTEVEGEEDEEGDEGEREEDGVNKSGDTFLLTLIRYTSNTVTRMKQVMASQVTIIITYLSLGCQGLANTSALFLGVSLGGMCEIHPDLWM